MGVNVPTRSQGGSLAPFSAARGVAAVVNWLAHAAVEEWGWQIVKLRGGPDMTPATKERHAEELARLHSLAARLRGRMEWHRVDD